MEQPRIPQILESLDAPNWSLASQLAKYQKRMTGAGQYLEAFKNGVGPEEIFAQEHDQITQEEILKRVVPIAEESVAAG